jgi:hypothetical protein
MTATLSVLTSHTTLDEAIAASLVALDLGVEGSCMVCGGATAPLRRRDGVLEQRCGDCGSVLEAPELRAA